MAQMMLKKLMGETDAYVPDPLDAELTAPYVWWPSLIRAAPIRETSLGFSLKAPMQRMKKMSILPLASTASLQ